MAENQPSIILVEDELAVAKLIEFKLKRENFDLKHYDNGLKGLEAIKKYKPDAVILDVMLPSMNGFEILRNIREDAEISETKVILLTSKNRVEDLKMGFGLKADEYIDKPFQPDSLILRLNRILNIN
ncbi:MAG: response regulator [Balneolaceae bacterium]|nr:response regulator [Balneolaceae bacterium]